MKDQSKNKIASFIQFLLLIAIIIVANIIGTSIYERFDLTSEKRYTLSDATKKLLLEIDDVMYFKVYLENEKFPAGFKRLQIATKELLNEFRVYSNKKIEFEFINPIADITDENAKNDIYRELVKKGLQPTNLKIKDDDSYAETIVFPGAIANYKGKETAIPLLQNQLSMSSQEVLHNSEVLMEFTLASAVKRLITNKKPKIGFILGHGELNLFETSEIRRALDETYEIDTINLSQLLYIPKIYEGIIIAKPIRPYEETNKFKIDQYIMNGGKVLWLIESLKADMRLMQDENGFTAQQNNHNLEDQLFRYGVRVNSDLVQDFYCLPIPIVVGQLGNAPQTQLLPWPYFPMVFSTVDHPIVKNLDALMFQFAATIDTISVPDIKKTVLLKTSQYSKALMTPVRVHLGMLKYKPDPNAFNQKNLPLAVLLEGEFTSVFKNRLAPETLTMLDTLNKISFKKKSTPTKMIVISDGDIMANEYDSKGTVYPLGYYRYTEQTFDNKTFLTNAIEYLCDENNIIQTRSKEFKIRLLDKIRIKEEKAKWQMVNIILPLILLLLFGLGYNFIRKKKFAF